MAWATLTGADYSDPEVYRTDKARVFMTSWVYAGRVEQAAVAGRWFAVDVCGESVIVICGKDGRLRAFYNVCRHRGAQICDGSAGETNGVLMCPYHNWCYDLEGTLVATPRVREEEIDRTALSLWPVHVDVWQGFVFVNLSREEPAPLRSALADQFDDPIRFERFDLGALRIGAVTEAVVAANWKVIIENYCECLHCPSVHPELVETVKAYKAGWVLEDGRDDGGVSLPAGGNSYAPQGRSDLTVMASMTELEANSIYGAMLIPNMFLDISGTGAVATQLLPEAADRTRVITQYLFVAEDVARPGFDPSPVVDFCELVSSQDFAVSERVQRGVSSRGFAGGVLPEKDEYVHEFVTRYLRLRDGSPGTA